MNDKNARIEGFFPTVVQFSKNPDAEAMHHALVPELKKIETSVKNSAPGIVDAPHYSTLWSGFNLLEKTAFHPLRDFIFNEAIHFAEFNKLDIQKFPLKLTESWVNIHSTDNYQEPHVHQNSIISGVYYVKVPETSGAFVLHSPYKYTMVTPPLTAHVPVTAYSQEISPEEGLAIFFRSFVEHSVRSNKSKQDRISISFNFTM